MDGTLGRITTRLDDGDHPRYHRPPVGMAELETVETMTMQPYATQTPAWMYQILSQPLSGIEWADSAVVHSGTYIMVAAYVLSRSSRGLADDDPLFVERMHLRTLPFAIATTIVCRWAWPHHHQPVQHPPSGRTIMIGAGIAAATFGSIVAVQTRCGWLQWIGWGTTTHTPLEIMGSMGWLALGHAAVAYNEEQLFRGHGLIVLSQAVGPSMARSILTLLFGVYHLDRWSWITMGTYTIAGVKYLMLRDISGNMAMPIAYHWTWNWLQNAIVGERPAVPTLIRVHNTGPKRWTGQLGEPVPGILTLLIRGLVALILIGWRWHRSTRVGTADHALPYR